MCSFLDLLDFDKMKQDKKICVWKGETSAILEIKYIEITLNILTCIEVLCIYGS